MATTNKIKPRPTPKSAKSPAPEKPDYKKFVVFTKSSSLEAKDIENYVADAIYDYGDTSSVGYVINEVETAEEEFNAAWEAA